MEGVARGKVLLLPHNPAWKSEFASVRQTLAWVFGESAIAIEHVGSTAIPAICAKPILDVAVQIADIADLPTEKLAALGYDYRGPQHGNENYHLFVLRSEEGLSLHHIHCYDKSEAEFAQLVGFRDYLNAHTDAAKEYERIKLALSQANAENRAQYTAGKAEFIRGIYQKMQNNPLLDR